MTLIPSLTFTDYEWFPWSICNGCGMPAGNAYPSGHLVPSPILGLANAPIVETKFLELAMSLLDSSPRIPLGTFSILLTSQRLGDCHFWWTRQSPMAHVAHVVNCGWFEAFNVHQSLSWKKKIDWNCNLWVNYIIPFGFSIFWHFWASLFIFCKDKDYWLGFTCWNMHMVHIVNEIR